MAYKAPKPGGGHVGGIQGQSLQVNVVGCRNLTNKEWFSRQDPYVILEYASTTFRTRTDTDGGKNPTFNEKFTLSLIEGLREMNVHVWNSNTVSLDDFIGTTKVLLDKVLTSGYDDSSWSLKSKSGKSSGEVNLILHYANAKAPKEGSSYASGYPPAPGGYPPSGYPPTGYPPAPAPAGYPSGPGAPSPYSSSAPTNYAAGYPPSHSVHGSSSGYPPQSGYPPPGSGYPPPASGYPPPASGYPPPASGYPPPASGYPPSTGFPPPASGYPPPASGYPPPSGASYGAPAGYPPGGYPAPHATPHATAYGAPYPAGYPPAPYLHGGVASGHLHVGSSGHHKHGKKKKYKGSKHKGWRWK